MKRVITFGEIMLRLNPEGSARFVQAEKFEASYAGGEANVAVSLANSVCSGSQPVGAPRCVAPARRAGR